MSKSIYKKFQLSKTEFLSAKYYAMRYKGWKKEGTEEARGKTELIERIVNQVGDDLSKWLLYAVTEESVPYEYMRMVKDMPCGYRKFYEMKREFYFLLAKEI